MACVIFDFDSTLICEESLEAILAPTLAARPEAMQRLHEITDLGMAGKLDFRESLSQRLAIASPSRAEVDAYGASARDRLTPGMPDLVGDLLARGVMVRIVSGGLREAIVPAARHLGIAEDAVHAVSVRWQNDGSFAGLDPDDPFSAGKVPALQRLAPTWPAPRIAVGDGMTDAQLWQVGLVDHFAVFTAHARRHAVLATGAPEAASVRVLRDLLEEWL